MPAAFDRCRKNGGRVRTETHDDDSSLDENQYRHVCYLGKKRYPGYVKTKKKNGFLKK